MNANEDIENILRENIDWASLASKSILVTGANGTIPAYIVYSLLFLNETKLKNQPLKVYALVRNKEKSLQKFSQFLKRADFKLIVCDVCDFVEFDEKLDTIIHAASQASPKYYGVDPVGTLKANTIGTCNMLEIARKNGAKKFLFISSGDVYGNLSGSCEKIEEKYNGNVDVTDVRSCYGESKRLGETMCVCYAHQYGLHVSMLRLAHTYGPGVSLNDGRVFADFAENVAQGENIVLNSDGSAARPFLYLTDMILALFYVLFYGENKQAYNVCADNATSILDLAKMLCALFPEKNLSVEFGGTIQKGYIRSASAGGILDNAKLKKLGWSPKIDIKTGFKRMINSYENNF